MHSAQSRNLKQAFKATQREQCKDRTVPFQYFLLLKWKRQYLKYFNISFGWNINRSTNHLLERSSSFEASVVTLSWSVIMCSDYIYSSYILKEIEARRNSSQFTASFSVSFVIWASCFFICLSVSQWHPWNRFLILGKGADRGDRDGGKRTWEKEKNSEEKLFSGIHNV